MTSRLSTSYLEKCCQDGGWPYLATHKPALESTFWCAVACRKNKKLAEATIEYLLKTQNADGGWPTEPGEGESDWSTAPAIACLNLLVSEVQDEQLADKTRKALATAIKKLVKLRSDLLTELTKVTFMTLQGPDFDYPHGWPWAPDTFHWVEPTAYAILAIKSSPFAQEKRYKSVVMEAREYLLEKTCDDGGWNFGAPKTFGVSWNSLPPPTALTLIALQNETHPKIQRALQYLSALTTVVEQSTIVDALSIIARDLHGEDMSQASKSFAERYDNRPHEGENLMTLAAATIANNLVKDGNPFKVTGGGG